jgi:hypothetical protein
MEYVLPYIIVKHVLWLTRHVIVEYGPHLTLRYLLLSMDYVLIDIFLSIVDHVVPDMLFIVKYEPHIFDISLIQKMQLGRKHQHHI